MRVLQLISSEQYGPDIYGLEQVVSGLGQSLEGKLIEAVVEGVRQVQLHDASTAAVHMTSDGLTRHSSG